LSAGTHPRIVAERLGHSTPTVTLNVYSHVTPTMQGEAAATLPSPKRWLESRGRRLKLPRMSERPDATLRRPQADTDVEYKRPSLPADVPTTTPATKRRQLPVKFWLALAIAVIQVTYGFLRGSGLVVAVASGLLDFVVISFVLNVLDWIRQRVIR